MRNLSPPTYFLGRPEKLLNIPQPHFSHLQNNHSKSAYNMQKCNGHRAQCSTRVQRLMVVIFTTVEPVCKERRDSQPGTRCTPTVARPHVPLPHPEPPGTSKGRVLRWETEPQPRLPWQRALDSETWVAVCLNCLTQALFQKCLRMPLTPAAKGMCHFCWESRLSSHFTDF